MKTQISQDSEIFNQFSFSKYDEGCKKYDNHQGHPYLVIGDKFKIITYLAIDCAIYPEDEENLVNELIKNEAEFEGVEEVLINSNGYGSFVISYVVDCLSRFENIELWEENLLESETIQTIIDEQKED